MTFATGLAVIACPASAWMTSSVMAARGGTTRWVGVAIIVLAGCAPSIGTEGAETARLLNEAYCDHALAPDCAPRAVDREGCLAYDLFAAMGRVVDEGRARLDPEAVQACLDGLECSRIPPVCFRISVGLGALGSACEWGTDCAPGLHCAGTVLGLGTISCGACAANVGLGEPCAGPACLQPEGDGDTSAECRAVDGVYACRVTVRRLVPDGAECGVVLEDPTRDVWVNRLCPTTSACTTGIDGIDRCQSERAPLGAACEQAFDLCVEGSFCGGGLCVQAPALGEPCAMTGPLSFACDETAGLVCVGGTCLPRPDEVGDACTSNGGCGSGLVCNLRGVCQERGPEGASCDFSSECESLRCNDGHCSNTAC